jgi:NTE family protein
MFDLAARLPRPISYVFGGGGSYGSVQVGQLRAFSRTDVEPDFVVGTSVGSLNATIVAETPHAAGDRLAAFWSMVRREDIFGSTRQAMVNMAALRPGIADPRPLQALLERSTASRDFADLKLPLTAVAADVATGAIAELRSGDLISALIASTAIPGVFPIVERDGQRLMDGGILANVPIGVAANQGAATLVVFDCGFNLFAPRTEPTLPHVLLRAAAMMSAQQVRNDLAMYSDRTILYLPGNWPPASRPYDFGKTAENNRKSYDAVMTWLAELELDGPGLYGLPPDVTRLTV